MRYGARYLACPIHRAYSVDQALSGTCIRETHTAMGGACKVKWLGARRLMLNGIKLMRSCCVRNFASSISHKHLPCGESRRGDGGEIKFFCHVRSCVWVSSGVGLLQPRPPGRKCNTNIKKVHDSYFKFSRGAQLISKATNSGFDEKKSPQLPASFARFRGLEPSSSRLSVCTNPVKKMRVGNKSVPFLTWSSIFDPPAADRMRSSISNR